MSKDTNKLSRLGLQATALYLVLLLTIVPTFGFFGWIVIEPISLNEFGDFLAGAFGPLAIFWLVLGFFQQGRELQNSIETLKLQATELANSVEQQKELVAVTKEGLEHDRELLRLEISERKKSLLPMFEISFKGISRSGKIDYKLTIVNAGASVSNSDIFLWDINHEMLFRDRELHFQNGNIMEKKLKGHARIEKPIELQINYRNSDNMAFENTYQLIPTPDGMWSDEFRVKLIEIGEISVESPPCS